MVPTLELVPAKLLFVLIKIILAELATICGALNYGGAGSVISLAIYIYAILAGVRLTTTNQALLVAGVILLNVAIVITIILIILTILKKGMCIE